MEKDIKSILKKYLVCFCVASGLVLAVFAIKGFFTSDAKMNIQILHDAFFSAGALLILFAGLLYVSGEGAFLGIGYALGRAIKALIPFSRKEHETYAQYRERKTGKHKGSGEGCLFFTGLFFVLISVIFLIIWYQM